MAARVFTSDDYAGIKGPGFTFYYGYEFAHGRLELQDDTDDGTSGWGFYYKVGSADQFALTYEEMAARPGCPDRFECQECLAFGMMLFIRKEQR